MWNAFEEIQGWSIGNVYEVTAVGTNKFKDALKLWSKSGGHNVVIDGTGGIFFSEFGFFLKGPDRLGHRLGRGHFARFMGFSDFSKGSPL